MNRKFPLNTSEIFGNPVEPQWSDNITTMSPRVVAVRRLRIVMTPLVILSLRVTYEREAKMVLFMKHQYVVMILLSDFN